ncbi:CAIB/BAIF family enzyme [Meredithblackwellia eburnea MCA 4105]
MLLRSSIFTACRQSLVPGGVRKRFLSAPATKQLPLAGVKILDLTTALAGPSCTMYLADLGAEVIKLEVPKKGDDTRSWGPPFVPHKEGLQTWESAQRQSTYYLAVNRNKRSVTVNLKSPKGIEIARKLAAQSDIVIENQIAGKLDTLGLGHEELKKTNPEVIYCSITGYGQTGPYRTWPGYDAVIGGEAGLVFATGEPDRAPVRPGIPVTDLSAGYNAAIACLGAYVQKLRTGKGVYIDVSMFDVQVAAMTNLASAWLNGGQEVVRVGTGHSNVAPYQVFTVKDGYLMIGIGNDIQFARLATAMGRPEWADSKLFKTNADRMKNKLSLVELMTEVFMSENQSTWYERFTGKGFPFGMVNNMEQVFNHPQAKARKLAVDVPHPLTGSVKMVGPSIMYDGERMPIRKPPPGLGEDTVEILKELGLEDEEIQGLRKDRVV